MRLHAPLDRASRRNAILREAKEPWVGVATKRGPSIADWTPTRQTKSRIKSRSPWTCYTGAKLRQIRARVFNHLGEIQR